MDGTPAIEAVGLTKMYGGFAAISNVNLTVRKGEPPSKPSPDC